MREHVCINNSSQFSASGLIYKNEEITSWLSTILGIKAYLVRQDPKAQRFSRKKDVPKAKISYTNEAQFLLVSRASMDDVNNKLKEKYATIQDFSHENYETSDWLIDRFRPNIIVNLPTPFEEDHVKQLIVYHNDSTVPLQFNVQSRCNRCTMICMDKKTCTKVDEPLKILSEYRRERGSVLFGIYISQASFLQDQFIHVGDTVTCTM